MEVAQKDIERFIRIYNPTDEHLGAGGRMEAPAARKENRLYYSHQGVRMKTI